MIEKMSQRIKKKTLERFMCSLKLSVFRAYKLKEIEKLKFNKLKKVNKKIKI